MPEHQQPTAQNKSTQLASDFQEKQSEETCRPLIFISLQDQKHLAQTMLSKREKQI